MVVHTLSGYGHSVVVSHLEQCSQQQAREGRRPGDVELRKIIWLVEERTKKQQHSE